MIDKEKVIKALDLCKYDPDPGQETKYVHSCSKCPYWNDGIAPECAFMYTDAINLLTRKAHWVWLQDCSNTGVYCSNCNTKMFESYPMKKKLSRYCGHCGAEMEDGVEVK